MLFKMQQIRNFMSIALRRCLFASVSLSKSLEEKKLNLKKIKEK